MESVGLSHNSGENGAAASTPESVSDPAPGRSCVASCVVVRPALCRISRRIRPAASPLVTLGVLLSPAIVRAADPLVDPLAAPLAGGTDLSGQYLFWLLMILMSAATYIYLTHREKKLADYDPDPWAEPELLDSVLLLAREQGAQLRLQASPSAEMTGQPVNGPSLSSVCVHFDRSRIILLPEKARPEKLRVDTRPAPQNTAASSDYIPMPVLDCVQPPLFPAGQNVRVDFCVKTGNENRTFQFDSVVLRADRSASTALADSATAINSEEHPDTPLLELARPSRVARFQRRTFERIRPHRADVSALGVWDWQPGPSLPLDPANLAEFPTPPLAMLPQCKENVRLDNISATGIALRVRATTLAETRTQGAKWRGCIVFLGLRENGNHSLMLWLACVRRHATVSASRPSSAVLGWEIAGWAETRDAQSPISWKSVASCGETPPLLRWIVRRLPMTRRYRRINL